jgi:Family of unknown function (DUF6527)
MVCAFGLPELVNHNAFIRNLEETGYLIDFVGGYLVLYGLPYLDKDGQLLVPDSHQIMSEGGMATVRPSIAVCDAPCKSHYFISAGRVEWLPAFSGAMASSVRRNQIARHAVRDAKSQSWDNRVRAAIARAFNKLRWILGI